MYDKVTEDEVVSIQLNTVSLTSVKYFTKTLKKLYFWKFISNEVIQTGNPLWNVCTQNGFQTQVH